MPEFNQTFDCFENLFTFAPENRQNYDFKRRKYFTKC